jgi:hypothetical protein
MKKTTTYNIGLLFAILAFVVMGCTSSGGSDDDDITPSTTVDGSVVKGYVKDATVFADRISSGTTQALDADEVSDISDENGDYDFEVPGDYGTYQLASVGGTIIGTGEPAPPMLAPYDADNITPVTTLVALVPDLRAKIGDLYDQDIADDGGANGAILALAMVIKTCLDSLDNAVSMTDGQQLSVIAAMADAFNDADTDLTDATQLAAATNTALETVLEDETVFPADEIVFDATAMAATIQTAVANVVAEIDMTSNTVIETTVLAVVEEEVAAIANSVENAITSIAKIALDSIALKNSIGATLETISSTEDAQTLTPTQANATVEIACTLTGRNDFAEKSYTAAELEIQVEDTLSSRKATVTISNVNVTLANGGAVTLEFSTETTLQVEGTTAANDAVTAEISNTSVQGDSNIVSLSSNVVTLDLDALDAKIENATDAEDLFDIGRTGNFVITMVEMTTVPLVDAFKTITVD